MQNVPRIYINEYLETGKSVPVDKEIVHYLRHVMRRKDCLIFNNGDEYSAILDENDKFLIIGEKTDHVDPSNNLILCFAPIKKMEDMLNMVTQMGVAVLQPVITQRTVAHHINWERMKKIIIEASEQSGRNSIPQLLEPIKFSDLDLNNLIVADERFAHGKQKESDNINSNKILIGPEGGFSDSEFDVMDKFGVVGMSLGKTILRAETAAVVAVSKVLNK
jgi:16S rRNA (uracil1498-N3)-methyltransferase